MNYSAKRERFTVAVSVFRISVATVRNLIKMFANVFQVADLGNRVVVVNAFPITAVSVRSLVRIPVNASISVRELIAVTEHVLRITVPVIRGIPSVINVLAVR